VILLSRVVTLLYMRFIYKNGRHNIQYTIRGKRSPDKSSIINPHFPSFNVHSYFGHAPLVKSFGEMWGRWWCILSGIVVASLVAGGGGRGVTLDVQVDGAIVHFTSPVETVRSQARIFYQTSGIEGLDCEKAIYTLAAAKISSEFPEAWIPNHDSYDVRSCRFTPDLVQVQLMAEDIAQDEEWRSTAPLEIFNIPPGKVISKAHMVIWIVLCYVSRVC
jgi:hypothetical protein